VKKRPFLRVNKKRETQGSKRILRKGDRGSHKARHPKNKPPQVARPGRSKSPKEKTQNHELGKKTRDSKKTRKVVQARELKDRRYCSVGETLAKGRMREQRSSSSLMPSKEK